jgi:hypothetical protein
MFGRRYGFIWSGDTVTSVNFQWTIEMYANFGSFGVIIGMALVGLLLSLSEKKFNNPDMSFLEFLVGLSILLPLTQPESSLVEMFGSIIPVSLAIVLIFHLGLRVKSS